MNVTIENFLCVYCDEVTEIYFRIINTVLFSGDENELRTGIENLKQKVPLDEYFTYGYGDDSRHYDDRNRASHEEAKHIMEYLNEHGIHIPLK